MYSVTVSKMFFLLQRLYAAHNNAIYLYMKTFRWENPEIGVYSITEICQPAKKSPRNNFRE